MDQKQYWDNLAETKEFTTPFQADEFMRFVGREKLILDIGCGYGRTMNEMRGLGYERLLGMDFSGKMIERGRKLFPGLDLRVMESSTIALPDESVDTAVLFAVLTCIRDDDGQRFLIEEIRRVLKPGGIIYVNDFLLNTDERNLQRYDQFKDLYGYGVFELPEGGTCRHHEIKWMEELLSDFTRLKLETVTFTTMNGHQSNGFFYFGRK
ncbi:SAM-dependent methyltransferase [Deltaproteobacteria bacterium Smac51]|nr:SAM-dependent methyltransferase [Deltaproteobacteria bacterium Smac51]